jgi:hypothetical protein
MTRTRRSILFVGVVCVFAILSEATGAQRFDPATGTFTPFQ